MRRSYISAILLLPLLILTQIQLAQAQQAGAADSYAPDTVLVKFRPGTAAAERSRAHASVQGNVSRRLDSTGVVEIRVPAGSVEAAISAYQRNPNVEYAEPSYRRPLYLPATTEGSEPSIGVENTFTEQWGLNNTGQGFGASVDPLFGTVTAPLYYGTADADIDAPEGWGDVPAGSGTTHHGSADIVIAVLDSGVACDHLDLEGKCVEQQNFTGGKSPSQADILGHGTHVAGIAAATTDNGVGIAGVGRNSRIGDLKVCWEDDSLAFLYGIIIGQCEDADIAAAIDHVIAARQATDSTHINYRVINLSLAGADASQTLAAAVDAARAAGIVVVAGAGNAYSADIMYPAGYANAIAVGSTDHHDNLSSFSTFGDWVSVLAPGSIITSTVPGEFCGQPAGVPSDCYDWKSGTSMATPHVAGLAALLWAHLPLPATSPAADADAVRSAIENSAQPSGALGQNFLAWSEHGRINLQAALASGGMEATSHHVQSIAVTTLNAGRGAKNGRATVTIVDNLGIPVTGATVSGSFSGSFNEDHQAVTGTDGVATFTTGASQKGGVTFQFCVTDAAAAGGATTYAEGDNLQSCAAF